MVDTNSDPNRIDFPIPANDDASKSIALIVDIMAKAIQEGLEEKKLEKDNEPNGKDEGAGKKTRAKKKVSQAKAPPEEKENTEAAPKKEEEAKKK